MKTIGITGGVGSGKSEILKYISANYNCMVITADRLAYELESPGHECYDQIVALLGHGILMDDGYIDRLAMAAEIFGTPDLIEQVNDIIHPAVKKHILAVIDEERNRNVLDYLFVEAALLVEEGYAEILDELWYIRVSPEIRRERLRSSRGYSDGKTDSIMANQLPDDEFVRACRVIIDNSGELEDTYRQIDKALRRE